MGRTPDQTYDLRPEETYFLVEVRVARRVTVRAAKIYRYDTLPNGRRELVDVGHPLDEGDQTTSNTT